MNWLDRWIITHDNSKWSGIINTVIVVVVAGSGPAFILGLLQGRSVLESLGLALLVGVVGLAGAFLLVRYLKWRSGDPSKDGTDPQPVPTSQTKQRAKNRARRKAATTSRRKSHNKSHHTKSHHTKSHR